MGDSAISKRIDQLISIGLKLQPDYSFGYENEEKKIFIRFDRLDIQFYEDEKWDKAFNEAKKLMETVNGNRS